MFNGRTHDLSNEMNLVICRVGTVGRMLPISLLRVYLSVSAVSVSVMGSELHQFHSKSCKEKWNHKFDLANDCFHSLNILFNPYLGDWAKLCWETITLTFNPHQLTWIIRVKKKRLLLNAMWKVILLLLAKWKTTGDRCSVLDLKLEYIMLLKKRRKKKPKHTKYPELISNGCGLKFCVV